MEYNVAIHKPFTHFKKAHKLVRREVLNGM
jgi:hypothetical protein